MKQNEMRTWVGTIAIVLSSGWAWAGSLDSPAAPSSPDSAMFTLNALYHRLNAGTPGSKRTDSFTQPSSGPAGTGHTIDEIMAIAPSTNTFGAIPSQVLAGTVYWGVMADAWGEKTGSMPNRGAVAITPSATQQAIQEGYHNGSGSVAGDVDLVTGNIRAGVNLFGVAGKTEVVDTTTGDAAAGDIRSGKKAWVDGAEITGSIATRTLSAANQTVNAGYYAATTLGAVDTDLAASNIAEGVTIFGLTGTHEYGGFNTGDVLVASANTQRSGISKDVMKKVKSIRVPRGGKFRFNWKWRSETTGNLVLTQIRRNGVIVGQLHGAKLTAWQTEWEDIGGWSANDTAELWVETNSDLHYYVQDFRIYVENPYNWAIVMD